MKHCFDSSKQNDFIVPQHLPADIGECQLEQGHCKGRNKTVLTILESVIQFERTA
ncbi:hypothetical protein [Salinicoccus sp. YB14-2]|uniref:hypothetical protein n=1 Tax=Salinicoccus sp. YB14-2 TaxID=1572701 RepID=UPI0012E311FA|nr:hypothetical protein [Salinicoccus sp. YB14-2]